jgi:mono/diheme cytochrome c family protein
LKRGLSAVALVLAAELLVTVAGCGSTKTVTRTVTAPGPSTTPGQQVSEEVAAGAHDFVQFACVKCHGERGRGDVSPAVPPLTQVGRSLSVAELRSIIDKGLGESKNPSEPYMPVWGNVISRRQVSDLVAYLRAGLPAVGGASAPPVPTDQGPAVQGAALYVAYGCINCHGPNGLGGVPNPQAPDKAIPPLSGAAFFREFNTDKKIVDVIRSGSVLGRPPIVSMPHWGGILSDPQLKALVAYIRTLRTV